MTGEPLSIYVHVPWCRAICPYCDFNVHRASGMREAAYRRAIAAEAVRAAGEPPFAGRHAATIFFGGGTPSLLDPATIEGLLEVLARAFPLEDSCEITLEANPENLEPDRLGRWRAAGVNRLSIGVQSFDARHLRTLGRASTADDAAESVARARDAGFDNVSVDLMFGVPGQSCEEWRADLERTLERHPEHVSAYGLTYEERTPFFALRESGRLRPVDEEVEAAMFLDARTTLTSAGYDAYEVSSFAKAGFESRHNRNYWRAGDYLGLGPGAHSHARAADGERRWSNLRDPAAYAERAIAEGRAIEMEESLDREARARERLFLGLRTSEGIDRADFRAAVGLEIEEAFPSIRHLAADGLVELDERSVRLSPRGILVADAVIAAAL